MSVESNITPAELPSPGAEFHRFWAAIHHGTPSDAVVEVRAFGPLGWKGRIETQCGFFQVGNAKPTGVTLGRYAKRDPAEQPTGVYLTINTVNSDLLARANGRMKPAEKERSATDEHVARRRWLLIDLDPKRPSGITDIPATDEERAAVFALADAIVEYLVGRGWPVPMRVDSGSGQHLYFAVDLPANDGDLVKRCLRALAAKFNRDDAAVDTSVFNPSRIARIPGFFNRKGDEVPGRPHRLCRVLSVPETISVTPIELLERLAAELLPPPSPPPAPPPPPRAGASASTAIFGDNRVKRCRAYLKKIPESVQGHHGSDRAFHAAAVIYVDFGIDEAEGFPLLEEYNREQCKPEWSEEELRRKWNEVVRTGGTIDRPRGWKLAEDRPGHEGSGRRPVPGGKDDRPAGAARPIVQIGTDEAACVRLTIDVLAALDEGLYVRDVGLVEVVWDKDGRPKIVPVSGANIRTRITKHCRVMTYKGGEIGWVDAHPPNWLAPAVRDHNHYPGVRPLKAISTSPILRPDGTIHQTPGYDPGTRLLYLPPPDEEYSAIPENPTRDDALAAAEMLLAGVIQFPWEAEADKAAWLAELLTLSVRHAIRGPCPLFFHTANTAGSGKTQLAKAAYRIAIGRDIPNRDYPMKRVGRDHCENDEELGKLATSCAAEGHIGFLLDNVPTGRRFGCSTLDSIVTMTTDSSRTFKTNEAAPARDFFTVFVATGNNIQPTGDTVRRTVGVSLASPAERPEEVEYEGPEVLQWATQQRRSLFPAAVTIVAAYIQAGRPDQQLTQFGSFEAWSDTVRSAIAWLGLPDPCQNKSKFVLEDDDSDRLRALVELVELVSPRGEPVTAADIVKRVKDDLEASRPYTVEKKAWNLASVDEGSYPAIDLFRQVCPHQVLPDAARLGYALRRYKGRTIDGKQIHSAPGDAHRKVAKWIVETIATNPSPAKRSPATGIRGDTLFSYGPENESPSPASPATHGPDLRGMSPESAGDEGDFSSSPAASPAEQTASNQGESGHLRGMRGMCTDTTRTHTPAGAHAHTNPLVGGTSSPASPASRSRNGTSNGHPDGHPATFVSFGETYEEGEL